MVLVERVILGNNSVSELGDSESPFRNALGVSFGAVLDLAMSTLRLARWDRLWSVWAISSSLENAARRQRMCLTRRRWRARDSPSQAPSLDDESEAFSGLRGSPTRFPSDEGPRGDWLSVGRVRRKGICE